MATKKRIRRQTGSALSVAAAVAMLVAPVVPTMREAEAGDWMPMLPDQDFYDFQLFAPPDLNEYGIWEQDHDGVYFNYDRLYWGITVPRVIPVGETPVGNQIIPSQPISPFTVADLNNQLLQFAATSPIILSTSGIAENEAGELASFFTSATLPNVASSPLVIQVGSDPLRLNLNTSWMRTKMTWGDRYEGGWSYGGRGVKLSYFTLGEQEQDFGTVNEFAVNSPSQTFTFSNTATGNEGGDDVPGGGFGGGAAQIAIGLDAEQDSPQPDHVITQNLLQRNSTEIQSAAVAMTLQRELGRQRGSTRATFSLGPRFVQFAERYELDYASFQNTFNTLGGGGGGINQGGNQQAVGGNVAVGENQQGGNQQGGNQQGGNQQGGNQQGGNQQAGNQQGIVTGPAGDIAIYQGNLGGAGAAGITVGDLPSTLTGVGPGSLFQAADWETYTSNNMVGPEFGIMFEGSTGRWDWYAGGSFTAGFNWQNNLYRGSNLPEGTGADYLRTNFSGGGTNTIAFSAPGTGESSLSFVQVPTTPLITQVFLTGQTNTTNSAEHRFVFSPIGEWRLGGKFRMSKSISLHFGYTGMWLSQIARASTNTGFRTVSKLNPNGTSNRTATIEANEVKNPGQTAVVNGQNILTGYVPNGTTAPLPTGFRYVPPTTTVVTQDSITGVTTRTVNNPEQYIELTNSFYTEQTPLSGGNEYVFTNGIDFGLEVKF